MSTTEPNAGSGANAVDEPASVPGGQIPPVAAVEDPEQDRRSADDAGVADVQPGVTPVELGELEPADQPAEIGNLELLRDIELTVTVEVGRARMRVKDLLGLHEGSVVELDRPVGSPVDLLANGRTIARGEIVLVEDQLGIRVTGFDSDSDGG